MLKRILQIGSIFMMSACLASTAMAQDNMYRYSVDLTKVKNDQLQVELKTPAMSQKTTTFFMPKIIPGTYSVSDFGLFVSEFTAYDAKGKKLPVKQLNTNAWQISKADQLSRVTYMVEDIFDSKKENKVYIMAASNIEENKNFVIQTPAFFGYFDDNKEIPFEVSITKPANFYGSTGLIPVSTTASKDVFRTPEYDMLMDSPIMYNEPDTTFITVGNAQVLVSVYSPNKMVNSKFLAEKFDKMLQAQKNYLGGRLPVDKYAFILYFAEPANANPRQGALEHSFSSFYYLTEMPQEMLADQLVDIAAHEFFHIITPLTIHSREIEDFNYNEPVMSKHLWLYEGVTEYASDHVQIRGKLMNDAEFLEKLTEKLQRSQGQYNDTLAFTELSKESAGKHSAQYGNVYEKGALIAALLDIRLLELSKGKKDLQDLIIQLSKQYGQNKPFEDDKLFEQIATMTYPEIGDFFRRYVAGNEALPYKEYFGKAGIIYTKEEGKKVASMGKVNFGYNAEKQMLEVAGTGSMNEFGKKMGYQKGDLIKSVKGKDLNPALMNVIMEDFSSNTKEGEIVGVVVLRADGTGDYKEVKLSAPAMLVASAPKVSLAIDEKASVEQIKLRNAWFHENAATANPADVANLNSIIASVYDVISGPAGERDWDRFHSLFKPEAKMGAIATNKGGKQVYMSMDPKTYQEKNAPFFAQSGFYEEELGRKVSQFGEVAHVWSAYQFKTDPNGKPEQRGINSIQLVFDQGRWWVTNLLWNSERPDNQIPAEMINAKQAAKKKK